MLEQYCQQTSELVLEKYGFTIPWELIIEAVLEILSKCLNNDQKDFVDAAKNPTVIQRVVVNMHIRKVMDDANRRKVVAVSNSLFETAANMTDEQLCGAYAEAHRILQPGQ